jgi:hypothetical protein
MSDVNVDLSTGTAVPVPSAVTVQIGNSTIRVDKDQLDEDYADIFMQTLSRSLDKAIEYAESGASTFLWVDDAHGSRLCLTFKQLYSNVERYLKGTHALKYACCNVVKVYKHDKKCKAPSGAGKSEPRTAADPAEVVRANTIT